MRADHFARGRCYTPSDKHDIFLDTGDRTYLTGYTLFMIITYHEGECIKVSAGDTTIVFGPVSKQSKQFKPTNFGADVAFISANHPDMNGADEAARGDRQPFVIQGPGEYEVKDITAHGYRSISNYGLERRINTIYSVHFDGLSLIYLGALDGDVPSEVLELDDIDVAFVPISADGTLSPADAHKAAVNLEAKIVIPMHYDDKLLKQFLKEAGQEDAQKTEKLTLKAKDVTGKAGEVIVITV